MLLVGLTGGIASGKSVVADYLADRGAAVIDADLLAREVVEPGTPGLAAIVERFGRGILTPAGALDRAALGTVVFGDPDARADLEGIVHPLVRRRARELTAAAPPEAIVVQVIPLLVETRQEEAFDVVVVVDCAPEVQVTRLKARNGLSGPQAEARLEAQATRAQRLAAADLVVDNSGTLADLTPKLASLWDSLVARSRAPLGAGSPGLRN